MTQKNAGHVVVTMKGMKKALEGTEATGNLHEGIAAGNSMSPLERAAMMNRIRGALVRLQQAEAEASAPVMTSTDDGAAARLQSYVASGENADLSFEGLKAGGVEAMFDTGDWFGWAKVAWEKLKNPIPHKLLRPKLALAEPFPEEGRVAVLGDWGTGLYGAPEIARTLKKDSDGFALLLHLGDVYYSGNKTEVQERFLDMWPSRSGTPSRALNSNHEMYSGGYAYFGQTLPAFGQEASYFAYQNSNWTLVGLDVAHKDHAIDEGQVAWLRQIIANAGSRHIVLFSHHQLYSQFESQGSKLLSHPGLRAILDSKRIFAWYWGHEHRCVIFEKPDPQFNLLGRCIGHSGMPQSRKATIGLPKAAGKIYERADWRRAAGKSVGGLMLPPAVVLDGENRFIKGEEEKFAPHGFAVLSFDGKHLIEQVLDPLGSLIYEKRMTG